MFGRLNPLGLLAAAPDAARTVAADAAARTGRMVAQAARTPAASSSVESLRQQAAPASRALLDLHPVVIGSAAAIAPRFLPAPA